MNGEPEVPRDLADSEQVPRQAGRVLVLDPAGTDELFGPRELPALLRQLPDPAHGST